MGNDTDPLTDLLGPSTDGDTREQPTTDDDGDSATPAATESTPATTTSESTAGATPSATATGSDPDSKPEPEPKPAPAPDTVTSATVIVDGEPITIDHDTTADELKAMTGAGDGDMLTFRPADADQPKQISDDEPVLNYVEPGTKLAFQPAQGDIFG